MRRSSPHLVLLGSSSVLLCLLAPGCEMGPAVDTPGEEVGEARVGEGSEAIIQGTLDNENTAVCAMIVETGGGFAPFCTATIIAKNGSTAYAITAAHCIDDGASPDALLCTPSYDDCPGATCKFFNVSTVTVHPAYDGSPINDVAMVTLTGASDAPVIPPGGAADGLAEGNPIEFSGYGVTNGFNQTPSDDRLHSFSIIDDADGDGTGLYTNAIEAPQGHDGPYGGTCFGDSGGPVFHGTGAAKRTVGVTSQGDGNCDQVGYYARIQFVWDFVNDYIGGEPPVPTCDECVNDSLINGACSAQYDACIGDAECGALFSCITVCADGDAACAQACKDQRPNGVAAYEAMSSCALCTACASTCQDPSCSGGTGAGATSGAGTGGGSGEGGGSSDDDDDDDDDDDGDDTSTGTGDGADGEESSCDCAVPGGASNSSNPAWLVGIALVAGLVGRRRKTG